jgi:hypothetical protein
MRRNRTFIGIVSLVLLLVAFAATSSARDDDFVVIVHPSNTVTSIPRRTLRAAYLKEGVTWSDGSVIVAIALSDSIAAHGHFAEDVLGKTTGQLKNHWIQRIFGGTGIPPIEVESPAAAIARVLADPHAVSYIPAGASPGNAKSIAVR